MKAISLETFWQLPQARLLLAYPDGFGAEERWIELQNHGIRAIYSFGPKHVQGMDILGLGYCGLVLLVQGESAQPLALKIRRANAPQPSLQAESQSLILANSVGVGPQLKSSSDNFLLMDYVAGFTPVAWLMHQPTLHQLHTVLRSLIDQAHRLDRLGLDHGDLRCITDHAVITQQGPILLDFSGASQERRPANVTTLIQGLFISTHIAKLVAPHFPHIEKQELIQHLRYYKQTPSTPALQCLYDYLKLLPADLLKE